MESPERMELKLPIRNSKPRMEFITRSLAGVKSRRPAGVSLRHKYLPYSEFISPNWLKEDYNKRLVGLQATTIFRRGVPVVNAQALVVLRSFMQGLELG